VLRHHKKYGDNVFAGGRFSARQFAVDSITKVKASTVRIASLHF
jgi:hypothetical protein